MSYVATSIACAIGLAACGETGDYYYRPIDEADYPKPDAALGEKLADGEIESTARIAAIIAGHLRRLYPTGVIYRDAHPKADGCVKATFTVNPDLGAPFNRGLFKTAQAYDAIIRFSNSNEDRNRSDANGDGRGMAIKIYGISEKPLTQDPLGPPAQDFILISHPAFIVADPNNYRTVVGYTDSENSLTRLVSPVVSFLSLGWTGTKNAIATTSLKIDNPLDIRYWSMVPYQLGAGPDAVAVKYSAKPCAVSDAAPPTKSDPDYLRHAMAQTLAQEGAGVCMKFMVQPRNLDTMSVEDPRYEWLEAEAPFHDVATITIPAQNFDTPQQNGACEQLSYSPWHALPEHKPLGAVNRMRKIIYERISALRRGSSAQTESAR